MLDKIIEFEFGIVKRAMQEGASYIGDARSWWPVSETSDCMLKN